MKTITIASQKGGAGKTTLAIHLATLAASEGRTLLLDLDPQGSLAYWRELRQAGEPMLISVNAKTMRQAVDAAKVEGIETILIDCPPHDSASMAEAMRLSDLVVIPTRPTALDIHAARATVSMAAGIRKPTIVVLSQAPARRGFGEPTLIRNARAVTGDMGADVAQNVIASRAVVASSIIAGLSVGELEPGSPAATEFENLWTELKGHL